MDHFFGYGSLVNRATHDYPAARGATLDGWRRVWVHTAQRPVAFLSVERAEGITIAGLVAAVPGGDWAALDAREHAYRRHPVIAEAETPIAAQVYAIPDGAGARPSRAHPILLSYLDVVVQGFLHEFGAAGAAAFFATTRGWDAPILDDRAAPRYLRAQILTTAERDLVDALLVGARGRPGCAASGAG